MIKRQIFRQGVRVLGALAFVSATALAASDQGTSAAPMADTAQDHANAVMEKKALLQSITRDACFKMAGIQGKDFGRRATVAIDGMYEALDVLRERYQQDVPGPRSLDRLAMIDTHWQTLSPALQQVSAGDYHAVPVAQILRLEPALQTELAGIHAKYQLSAGGTGLREIALVQKMRVHQLTKEACLVLRDISAEANRKRLSKTMADVDAVLSADPLHLNTAQMASLSEHWVPLKTLLVDLLQADQVSDASKVQLSRLSDALIGELTKVK